MAAKKPSKIKMDEALNFCKMDSGNYEVQEEFHYLVETNGLEVLMVGFSFEPPMPGFPNPPRTFRYRVFIDGKPKSGGLISP